MTVDDEYVLECLRDGARTLADIERFVEDDDAQLPAEPVLKLILARLREANLVRYIGEGARRRYVPTPRAFNDGDRRLRRAEDTVR